MKDSFTVSCSGPACKYKFKFNTSLSALDVTEKCPLCGTNNHITLSDDDMSLIYRQGQMVVRCTNADCGKLTVVHTPRYKGKYSSICPSCHKIIRWVYEPETAAPKPTSKPEEAPKPKVTPKVGFDEQGNYVAQCTSCKQFYRFPPRFFHVGHNSLPCGTCHSSINFYIEPKVENMLKCSCGAALPAPGGNVNNEKYTATCPKCNNSYTVTVSQGVVTKVVPKTFIPANTLNLIGSLKLEYRQSIFKSYEYLLTPGAHVVGRRNDVRPSDFMIDDPLVSAQSIRIEVTGEGANLKYKMRVQRATNRVMLNRIILMEGQEIYLNPGDVIRLGQTNIYVTKCK